MHNLFQLLMMCGLAFITAVPKVHAAQDPRAKEISRKMDELYRSDSSRGRMKMTVTTPNYERELEMKMWTRGEDDTLVRIQSPRKEKGTSTLKKGNEMWNYLPKIRKTIRVPPSLMMSSWMGSDFTNDDIVSSSSWEEDYSAKLMDEAPANQTCIEYEAKPNAAVAWPRVVACVEAKQLYPIKQEFYDEKGRLARVMEFDRVKEMGGRTLPTRLTLKPLLKEGHETVVVYQDIEFDVKLDDDLFSLTNLRRSR